MEKRLAKLINETKNGDDAAFSELCADFAPLMKSQVTKLFGDSPFEFDDRLQDAAMALYDAVSTFDTSQYKVTFGLYAKICIRNRLISIKRKEKKEDRADLLFLSRFQVLQKQLFYCHHTRCRQWYRQK